MLARFEVRKNGDLAAGGHALRRCDLVGVFERDALRRNEFFEPIQAILRIAFCGGELRERVAFGLAHVEDMRRAEPEEARMFVFSQFRLGLLLAHHRGENDDALLALADITPERPALYRTCGYYKLFPSFLSILIPRPPPPGETNDA